MHPGWLLKPNWKLKMKDMIDRLMPPGLKSPLDFILRLPAFEIATLENGVQVYQVNGGAEDVIKIDWVFEAGNVFENKNGVAAATRELINSGTSNKSAYDISNQFEYYGAYYSTAGFSENAVITVNSLTKHIGDLLPVVREILTDAAFPEDEVALYKQNRIQRLKVYLKKSEFLADRLVNEALFGADHPYGRKVEIEDIEKIDRESLIAFYKSYFQEGNCRIFVSGKFTEKVVSLLNEFFGDLKFTSKKKITPAALHPMKEKVLHRVVNREGVQGAIRLARTFPVLTDPDYKPALVLNTLLGGYFGSRLMSNIREEKGYTYGIYSYIQHYPDVGVWQVATEAGRDVAEAAIEESFKEMKVLCETKVQDDELKLVKNYMLGKRLASLDGPFKVMERIKGLVLNDVDQSFFEETVEVIKGVTADQLQELAVKYLQRESFYNVLVI